MSGRIYDCGINPKCDICGSKMWTSSDTNFNGCQCKRKGCNGKPIYEPFNNVVSKTNVECKNGKYILEGTFTKFGNSKNKYTFFEKFKNFTYTLKEKFMLQIRKYYY